MTKPKPLKYIFAGSLATTFTALYAWWYLTKACKKPKVFVSEGPFKELLRKDVKNLWKPYRPTPWLVFSHLQTMGGVIRRIGGDIYNRELITTEDGGTLGLDWFKEGNLHEGWKPDTPIVLVMHGITGGSQEGYCRWMCKSACNNGWRSLVLNYRGCNGLPHTSDIGYSVTVTMDIHTVVNHIKRKYPNAPLFVASYSMGSLMLFNYLGESDEKSKYGGSASQISAAAFVSCPMCMKTNSQKIEIPWSIGYIFNLVIAYRLKQYAKEHHDQCGPSFGVDSEAVLKSKTIREFEEATICPIYGDSSIEEYREQGSSRTHIPNILTRSLILISEDDPFIGDIPYAEILSNPNTALGLTSRGGHVAFLQGIWPFGQGWIEDTLIQFFNAIHKDSKSSTTSNGPTQTKAIKFLSSLLVG